MFDNYSVTFNDYYVYYEYESIIRLSVLTDLFILLDTILHNNIVPIMYFLSYHCITYPAECFLYFYRCVVPDVIKYFVVEYTLSFKQCLSCLQNIKYLVSFILRNILCHLNSLKYYLYYTVSEVYKYHTYLNM